MVVAMQAQAAPTAHQQRSAGNIVFFDVETNVPGRSCRSYELLEFGAVVLDARGLGELGSFHTLVRPTDLSCIDHRTTDCNRITTATVADAPPFEDVADDIYQLLHGNIWAGHNILKFDILRVNEAFSKVGKPAPQPAGVVDTYPLLRRTFGKRAGNYKLATLANYCGFGKQEHRSIADVRMNIDVLRSCATLLFLESNYPDIFMGQMELTASTLEFEQSISFSASSPQNKVFGNDHGEQEVDSQIRFSNKAGDSCSASQPVQSKSQLSFQIDATTEVLDEVDSLKGSGLSHAFVDLKLGDDPGKEDRTCLEGQTYDSLSRAIMDDEQCVESKASEALSILRSNHAQQELLTGLERIGESASAVEVVDVMSVNVEGSLVCGEADEMLSKQESEGSKPITDNLLGTRNEQALVSAPCSLSLQGGSRNDAASGIDMPEAESSSMVDVCKSAGSLPKLEGLPFLLPSHVDLPSIQVCEETSSYYGFDKVLNYEGYPLHLLEFNMKVRFTVNMSYAFDDKGKPKFSILIEPSETACNVIRKCEDLVKSMMDAGSEVEWLPALKKEYGCWVARMRIGTRWINTSAVYTTEFSRNTPDGLEKISMDPVDAATFKSVLPHGSFIDAGFGFYVFNMNNQRGVRLLAKHIILH